MTFQECAETHIAAMQASWKSAKHGGQWPATLRTYVYPVFGAVPVAEVDTPHVLAVLTPIWNSKTETAGRVRGRIERVLDSAKVHGHRSGENPARWPGHLALILPAKSAVSRVEHHASLAYADMPSFWLKLQAHDGLGARALELTILCASRTSEVLQARWDELDQAGAVWSIPGERMKSGVAIAYRCLILRWRCSANSPRSARASWCSLAMFRDGLYRIWRWRWCCGA